MKIKIEDYLAEAEKSFANKEYQKALSDYEKAISIDPKNLDALVGRADSLVSLGMREEATEAYQRAFSLVVYQQIDVIKELINPNDPKPNENKNQVSNASISNSDLAFTRNLLENGPQRLQEPTENKEQSGNFGLSSSDIDYIKNLNSLGQIPYEGQGDNTEVSQVDLSGQTPNNTPDLH